MFLEEEKFREEIGPSSNICSTNYINFAILISFGQATMRTGLATVCEWLGFMFY